MCEILGSYNSQYWDYGLLRCSLYRVVVCYSKMLATIYQTTKQDHNCSIHCCVRSLILTYFQIGLFLNTPFFYHLFIALYHASHWKLNQNDSTLHVFDSHIYRQAFGNVIRNHKIGNRGLLYIWLCCKHVCRISSAFRLSTSAYFLMPAM